MHICAFHKGPGVVGKGMWLDLDKPKILSTELDLHSSRFGLVVP